MRALILGHSDIARRRILPALRRCGINEVDIASHSAAASVSWPEGMGGAAYADYAEAIRASTAELVWVSTVNSLHAALATQALHVGHHVIIDKPAATTSADVAQLVALARHRRLVLAEAHVFAFHPQIEAARQAFAAAGSSPTQIVAAFSYPPLPYGNFRHRPDLGGGALLDLGPYAMALGRLFFAAAPTQLAYVGVGGDRGFSVLALYPGGRSVAGHFGMTTGYVNQLMLLGPSVTLAMTRVFTTPPELANRLQVTVAGQPGEIEVPAADSFACFIDQVLAAIAGGDRAPLLDAMLADAAAVDRLRAAQDASRHDAIDPSSSPR
jgi:predicted dehydrogenase